MRAELKVDHILEKAYYAKPVRLEGDTLFFFNYRSDRMREITTVFGELDDVVEAKIPKNLVIYFMPSNIVTHK